ncbi:MAG: fibronectin type III domain-containing protein, partial [Thermoplasmata archaeon]|nr:fibronectin type III domain-containing protein [Thermoplasmata archaeon]
SGAFEEDYALGLDAYVCKLNLGGSALVYSTYVGGTTDDEGWGIALDEDNSAYVAGYTFSTNFPTTSGAFDNTTDIAGDAFVLHLSADGSSILQCTCLGGTALGGGTGTDLGTDVEIDDEGNVYVTGQTLSFTDFPTAGGPYVSTGLMGDAFLSRLSPDLSSLKYSTYLGGELLDSGERIALTGDNVYVVGWTSSVGFPTTEGANDTTLGGGYDMFVYAENCILGPSVPLNFMATPGDGQVELEWVEPSTTGGFPITNYTIYRGTEADDLTPLVTLEVVLNYTDTNVTNDQTYHYAISATNSDGSEGKLSAVKDATPNVGGIVITVPGAPDNFVATASNGSVNLEWSAPDDGGAAITSYTVYRGTNSDNLSLLVSLGNVTSYTDSAMTNDQTYHYAVSATNSVGEGTISSEASATPAEGLGKPSAPRDLTATGAKGKVYLEWNAPTDTGGSLIIEYLIYRSNDSEVQNYWDKVNGTVLVFEDIYVVGGEKYYYSITAVNSAGESSHSNVEYTTPSVQDTTTTSGSGFSLAGNACFYVGAVALVAVLVLVVLIS